jgi:hypothetical protein
VRTHPYADAVYEVVPLAAGGFGVKISVPSSSPTTVSRFDTEAAAEAWIDEHKQRIQSQSQPKATFRRAKPLATNG